MIKLSISLVGKFSTGFFCPVISIKEPYQPLAYSTYYRNRHKSFQMSKPNCHQLDQNTIIQFLEKQINKDKVLFHKQKQIIFIGRSNSGKSSLINILFDKEVCRTSKHAGTTKFLHFHGLSDNKGMLVDTPGYGFANMNKKRRNMWFGSVLQYMKVSSRVSQVFICVSTLLGLMPNDIQVLKRINDLNVQIQIVLTKSDKLKDDKLYFRMVQTAKTIQQKGFKNVSDRIHACSIRTLFGIDDIKKCMAGVLLQSKQRNVDGKEQLLLDYLKDNRIQEVDINQKQQKSLTKPYLIRKLIYNSEISKFLK